MKDTVLKQAMMAGIVRTCGLDALKADSLYRSVLWNDTVKKIKPYNLIKNYKKANDATGLLSDWVDFITSGAENEAAATRRLERAFKRISVLYSDIFPEVIRGEDNLNLMLRVLFLSIEDFMSLDVDSRLTATAIEHILQTIFLLELVFGLTSYRGLTQEEWIYRLLSNFSCIPVLDFLGEGNSHD